VITADAGRNSREKPWDESRAVDLYYFPKDCGVRDKPTEPVSRPEAYWLGANHGNRPENYRRGDLVCDGISTATDGRTLQVQSMRNHTGHRGHDRSPVHGCDSHRVRFRTGGRCIPRRIATDDALVIVYGTAGEQYDDRSHAGGRARRLARLLNETARSSGEFTVSGRFWRRRPRSIREASDIRTRSLPEHSGIVVESRVPDPNRPAGARLSAGGETIGPSATGRPVL